MVGNNWGPLALYPLETFQAVRDVVTDVPAIEKAEVLQWPETFPGLAARIRIPVRLTFAEHEDWWCHDPTDLAHLRQSFVNAPRVVIDEQPAAGHNISLGSAAKAYHLGALAFFEESLQL